MKNITLKVDDATYRRARMVAAERGTSVSAMVREFLQRQGVESERHAERLRELEAAYRNRKPADPAGPPLKPLRRDEIYDERHG